MNKIDTLAAVFNELSGGSKTAAEKLLNQGYPHEPKATVKRSYTTNKSLSIFIRDGFIDRYSGNRLLFPGLLRVLSLKMPKSFPYHPHWKMTDTHIAYWEFQPTVDHVDPIARGGTNDDKNLVTTSQLRNSAKANWTLDELGWELHPAGDVSKWDGLMGATLAYVEKCPELLDDGLLRKWCRAADRADVAIV